LKFAHALHTWVGTAVVNGYISIWFSALMDCVESLVLGSFEPYSDKKKPLALMRFLKITVWFGAWVFIVFPLLFATEIDKSGGNYLKNVYFTIMTGTTIGYGDLNAGITHGSGWFARKSQMLMYTAGMWMPAAVELFGRFAAAMVGEAPSTDIKAWMCGKTEEEVAAKEPPCPAPVMEPGQACTYLYAECTEEMLSGVPNGNLKAMNIFMAMKYDRERLLQKPTPEYLLFLVSEQFISTLKKSEGSEGLQISAPGGLPASCDPQECNAQLEKECAVSTLTQKQDKCVKRLTFGPELKKLDKNETRDETGKSYLEKLQEEAEKKINELKDA